VLTSILLGGRTSGADHLACGTPGSEPGISSLEKSGSESGNKSHGNSGNKPTVEGATIIKSPSIKTSSSLLDALEQPQESIFHRPVKGKETKDDKPNLLNLFFGGNK
jgi:hypothetical protein